MKKLYQVQYRGIYRWKTVYETDNKNKAIELLDYFTQKQAMTIWRYKTISFGGAK